jgi:hypothetical protein
LVLFGLWVWSVWFVLVCFGLFWCVLVCLVFVYFCLLGASFVGDALAARAFISFARPKETNQRKAAGCISEAKNRAVFPKTAKRASLERGRFFTEKSHDFLHASPKRPELDSELGRIEGEGRDKGELDNWMGTFIHLLDSLLTKASDLSNLPARQLVGKTINIGFIQFSKSIQL